MHPSSRRGMYSVDHKLTLPEGGYSILYFLISVKIKQKWFLGEALPALIMGIILGPIAAKFIDSTRWGSAVKEQTSDITLVCLIQNFERLQLMHLYQGMTRVVIGIQLVMAGYQLPSKYPWTRWRDMMMVLIPIMTIMCKSHPLYEVNLKQTLTAYIRLQGCARPDASNS